MRHDGERSLRMHRELVEAILDNRPRDITAAVRTHSQDSAGERLELLRRRARALPECSSLGGSANSVRFRLVAGHVRLPAAWNCRIERGKHWSVS